MNQARTELRSVTFAAPLPPRELHQNGRRDVRGRALNPWSRNKAVQDYRFEVGVCIQAAAGRHRTTFDRGLLSLEFVVPDYRRRDILNYAAAFKPGIDALVDVGIIPDDDAEHLQIGQLSMRVAAKGEMPSVNVTITEMREETQ